MGRGPLGALSPQLGASEASDSVPSPLVPCCFQPLPQPLSSSPVLPLALTPTSTNPSYGPIHALDPLPHGPTALEQGQKGAGDGVTGTTFPASWSVGKGPGVTGLSAGGTSP